MSFVVLIIINFRFGASREHVHCIYGYRIKHTRQWKKLIVRSNGDEKHEILNVHLLEKKNTDYYEGDRQSH